MPASPIQRSPLWDRVALSEIPTCSAAQFIGLGIVPAVAVVLLVGLSAWYAVLSGYARGPMLALEAERLQAIEPAAGGPINH